MPDLGNFERAIAQERANEIAEWFKSGTFPFPGSAVAATIFFKYDDGGEIRVDIEMGKDGQKVSTPK